MMFHFSQDIDKLLQQPGQQRGARGELRPQDMLVRRVRAATGTAQPVQRGDAQRAGEAEGDVERHVPEDEGELLVREGERPEAQVGCCVGDAVEAEFCGGFC